MCHLNTSSRLSPADRIATATRPHLFCLAESTQPYNYIIVKCNKRVWSPEPVCRHLSLAGQPAAAAGHHLFSPAEPGRRRHVRATRQVASSVRPRVFLVLALLCLVLLVTLWKKH